MKIRQAHLPTGWEVKKLGDICNVIGGGTPSKAIEDYFKGDIPWATVRDMRSDIITKTEFRITTEAVKKSSTNIIPKGNVIIATRVGLGKVCFNENDTAINQDLRGIIPIDDIIPVQYLFWWLKSISQRIIEEGTGATVQGVKLPFIKSLQIPFPEDKTEQQRIVSLLDETFAVIEQAKANVERNLQNAKELFQSELQDLFEINQHGWIERVLQDIVETDCTLSYGIVQPGVDYANGLPIIRPTDLTSKLINLSGLKLIDPELANSYKRTTLKGYELLLCVRGNTGVVSIATKELKGANVTRGIVPIRFNTEIIIPDFGYYQFISNYVLKQIKAKTYGAALMQINIGDLRKINLIVPTIEIQQQIVERLDALSAATKKLESKYQAKLAALEELKKSVLEKAFKGEI